MKKVLLFALSGLLFSCGNAGRNSTADTPDAAHFYETALQLNGGMTPERDTVLKALALLDSAIRLDPQYKEAYILKQVYQARLGEYGEALKTLETLQTFGPHNADALSVGGVYALMLDDNDQAEKMLRQADSLWAQELDTLAPDNEMRLLHILVNRASANRLLGNESGANDLYHRLLTDSVFQQNAYAGVRSDIESVFLDQTRDSFREYVLRGLKQNEL